MENRPRDERVEKDAPGVSSDVQRLFEESSFGSPQAQQAYTPPPSHLVTDIVQQVRAILAVDIERSFKTAQVSDGQRQGSPLNLLEELRAAFQELSFEDVACKQLVDPGCGQPQDQDDCYPVRDLSSSLMGSPSLPAGAADSLPGAPDQRAEDIMIRLGLRAFELAQDYLALGRLGRAVHWLTVAGEHDIPDAQALLADIAAVQNAFDSEETATRQERQTTIVDQFHEAADVLRRAREKAQAIIDEAHSTAENILTEARREATTNDGEEALTHLLKPWPWLPPVIWPSVVRSYACTVCDSADLVVEPEELRAKPDEDLHNCSTGHSTSKHTDLKADEQAGSVALQLRPDIAVVSPDSPTASALTTELKLDRRLFESHIVALTVKRPAGLLKWLLAVDVPGLVDENASATQLLHAVRNVAEGCTVIDANLVMAALSAGSNPFTPRELTVLKLAAEGASGPEIARQLSLSPGTVRNYLSNAMNKTGARTRIDAIRIATESGWL